MFTGHFGRGGTGKTHLLMERVGAAHSGGRECVAISGNGEWVYGSQGNPDPIIRKLVPEIVVARTAEEAFAVLGQPSPTTRQPIRFVVLFTGAPEFSEKRPDRNRAPLIEKVSALAIQRKNIVLAVSEAHEHFGLHDAVWPCTATLITQHRHYGIDLFADTQRFSAMSSRVRGQIEETRLFGMSGETDLEIVQSWGDRTLRELVARASFLAGDKNADGSPKEKDPGWHVRIIGDPVPPYELRKGV